MPCDWVHCWLAASVPNVYDLSEIDNGTESLMAHIIPLCAVINQID